MKSSSRKAAKLFAKHLLVPARIERELVIGDRQRATLDFRQVFEHDHRNFAHAQRQGRAVAPFTRDDPAVSPNENRDSQNRNSLMEAAICSTCSQRSASEGWRRSGSVDPRASARFGYPDSSWLRLLSSLRFAICQPRLPASGSMRSKSKKIAEKSRPRQSIF